MEELLYERKTKKKNQAKQTSDECPCGTGPQTPNHILQSCPTFDALRRQTWPSPVEAHRKLWGPVETLRQTVDLALLTGLKTSMAGRAGEDTAADCGLGLTDRTEDLHGREGRRRHCGRLWTWPY